MTSQWCCCTNPTIGAKALHCSTCDKPFASKLELLRGFARVAAWRNEKSPTRTVRERPEYATLTIAAQTLLLEYCAGLEAGVLMKTRRRRA